MPITSAEIDNWFQYHAPTSEQQQRLVTVREAAKAFAYVLLTNTTPSADQSAAFRLLRECVMTANASIVIPPMQLTLPSVVNNPAA